MLKLEDKLIVYHIKNNTAIDVFHAKTASCFSEIQNEKLKINEVTKQNRIAYKIQKTNNINLSTGFYISEINHKKIGILVSDTLSNYKIENYSLDVLVLTANPYLKGIDDKISGQIIIDGNNSTKTRKYLKNKQLKNCYFTSENGAFELKLN
jgi:hypothetical protein